MQLTEKHQAYWRRSQRLTIALLVVWFVVTFVASFFARDLATTTVFGFPLGFYIGAQGALVVYVAIIWIYARYMNRLDDEFGVGEAEE